MKHQKGFTAVEMIGLILVLALGIGWVLNIIAIAHSSFSQLTGELILRCIGVFMVPLGAVMGFI